MFWKKLKDPGPIITFVNSAGQFIKGELSIVPAYEGMDVVYVHDGVQMNIYELATGRKLCASIGQNKHEAAADAIRNFVNNNVSDKTLLAKIYSSDHTMGQLRAVNNSPKYEKYKAAQKAIEDARPFLWNEEERKLLQQKLDEAIELDMPKNTLEIMEAQLNERLNKWNASRKTNITGVLEAFDRNKRRHFARKIMAKGDKLPRSLWDPYFHITDISQPSFIAVLNSGRKRDITRHIPEYLLRDFYILWSLVKEKNNIWGYYRFKAVGEAYLIRLAIDLKKGRDESETIVEIQHLIRNTLQQVRQETQKFEFQPGE